MDSHLYHQINQPTPPAREPLSAAVEYGVSPAPRAAASSSSASTGQGSRWNAFPYSNHGYHDFRPSPTSPFVPAAAGHGGVQSSFPLDREIDVSSQYCVTNQSTSYHVRHANGPWVAVPDTMCFEIDYQTLSSPSSVSLFPAHQNEQPRIQISLDSNPAFSHHAPHPGPSSASSQAMVSNPEEPEREIFANLNTYPSANDPSFFSWTSLPGELTRNDSINTEQTTDGECINDCEYPLHLSQYLFNVKWNLQRCIDLHVRAVIADVDTPSLLAEFPV